MSCWFFWLLQYVIGPAQLAVNPEIKSVLLETTPGKTLSEAEKMETVRQNLMNVQKADAENIMAVWIADLDTSSFIQSDGYTSGDDWNITERVWYDACDGPDGAICGSGNGKSNFKRCNSGFR